MKLLIDSVKSAISKLVFYSIAGLIAAALLSVATFVLLAPLMIAHSLGAVTEAMKSYPYSNWLFYVSLVWFCLILSIFYELENRGAFKINNNQSFHGNKKGITK
tara:strand:- start:162 stop:473 length:312 start_codon:yes stop_codon:yes gene_type:complete